MPAAADILITGAGIIGLTLALELRRRGLSVILLEARQAGAQASSAAAGMLAAHDPANPPELTALAEHSIALYPALLAHIEALTGIAVPFETAYTLELAAASTAGYRFSSAAAAARLYEPISERSVDPRKLLPALVRAARFAGAGLREDSRVLGLTETATGVFAKTSSESFSAGQHIHCSGAWSGPETRPAKGQMLRVRVPEGLLTLPGQGNLVLRTPEVYIVPRLDGTAILGATIEDAGFSLSTAEHAMQTLRSRAGALLPALPSATEVERWAGLRPRTADDLPILGRISVRRYSATGHFRNGILLAPGSAQAMADLVLNQPPSVDLAHFAPSRFAQSVPMSTSA